MLTLGIDIGSTACKAVLLADGTRVAGRAVVQTGTGTSGPGRVYEEIFRVSGASPAEVRASVVTGYGRASFEKADRQISELSCHARGVHFLCPAARTVIDIGGQDAKVLSLSPAGTMSGFVMNDKCAAGTGRFLDVMARVLELDVSELAALSEKADAPAPISNVCTVFAESEVISRLAAGSSPASIAAGIHLSVANRVGGLARRAGIVPAVVITGGVAQNAGVVRALSEVLGTPIEAAPLPQFTGALGAALLAYESAAKAQ